MASATSTPGLLAARLLSLYYASLAASPMATVASLIDALRGARAAGLLWHVCCRLIMLVQYAFPGATCYDKIRALLDRIEDKGPLAAELHNTLRELRTDAQ